MFVCTEAAAAAAARTRPRKLTAAAKMLSESYARVYVYAHVCLRTSASLREAASCLAVSACSLFIRPTVVRVQMSAE